MASTTRRSALAAGLATVLGGLACPGAVAQVWPTKPIKLIVPFPPGGATDSVARLLADALTPRLGQPVVIDNKAGAATVIGVDAVVKSPTDGYTLLVSGASSYAIVPALHVRLPFDVTKDLLPIALVAYAPLVVVTSPSKPYQRLADVIAQAKAKPARLTYSTYGPGSQPHLAAELLADAAGVEWEAIPYKGSADALIALMRGDVDVGVETVSAASAHIHAGKLRALAVNSGRRSGFLPQVPGLDELGLSSASMQGFYAVAAPAGTPAPVVQRLVKEIAEIMAMAESKAKCEGLSLEAVAVGPEGMRSVMNAQIARYRDLNKRLKISLD
jgi:tripartite-type tricarboxylate transporter receptor subunit TctC